MKNIFVIIVVFLFVNITFGQYVPISMEEKLEKSINIVEGKVIAQKSYQGDDDEIYTENIIRITEIYKGQMMDSLISVVTFGGVFENILYSWSHLLHLEIEQYGVFFLEETFRPLNKKSIYSQYEVYSGAQGFYQFFDSKGTIKVADVLTNYESVSSFYQAIGIIDENKFVKEFNRSINGDNCLNYRIELINQADISTTQSDVYFNVYLSLPVGEERLFSSEFTLRYGTDWFGSDIVANSNIDFQFDSIFQQNYSIQFNDNESDIVQVSLTANLPIYDELIEINANEILVGRLRLNLINIGEGIPLESDFSSNVLENKYLSEDGYEMNFECLTVEIGRDCDPIIETVTLRHPAGIGSTLVITGQNFIHPDHEKTFCNKLPDKEHRVLFQTVSGKIWISPLTEDYDTWTNTLIKVKVPTVGFINYSFDRTSTMLNPDDIAGTGLIEVCTKLKKNGKKCKCGDRTKKDNELYIPFAAINSKHSNFSIGNCWHSYETKLRDLGGNGGYILTLTPSFINNLGDEGKSAFIRAMNNWRCKIFFNFELGDGGIPISYESLPIGTSSAVLARTSINEKACDGNLKSRLAFDKMVFRKANNWYLGTNKTPNTKLNFEASATHELGHSIGLLHTKNKENLMFPSTNYGKKKKIQPDDEEGGNHRVSDGETSISDCGDIVIPLTGDCLISTLNNDIKSSETLMKIEYNNDGSKIRFVKLIDYKPYKELNVHIFSSLGLLVKEFKINNKTNDFIIDITKLPSGFYFIVIDDLKNIYQSTKIIKI